MMRSDIELYIDVTDWPEATDQGVRSLFLAVYEELSQAFGVAIQVPINLSWRAKTPNTKCFPDRTEILLSAYGNRWNQFVYQASHELTHALIRDFSWLTGQRKHKWFEEALCELASYYVLCRFAETWKHTPIVGLSDFVSTRSYAANHRSYCAGDIQKKVPELPVDLKQWLKENVEVLTEHRYNRRLNAVVAVALLPDFLRYPSIWRDCVFLDQWDTTQDETFEDYLKSWWAHMRSRNVHPQGVPLDVANLLGLDIGVRATGVASGSLKSMFPNLRVPNSFNDG